MTKLEDNLIDLRNEELQVKVSSIVISPLGNYRNLQLTSNLALRLTPTQVVQLKEVLQKA